MAQSCIFSDPLKLADVSAVYKDCNSSSKSNYRLISVLSAFSKVFERLLERQMAPFIEPKLASNIYTTHTNQVCVVWCWWIYQKHMTVYPMTYF